MIKFAILGIQRTGTTLIRTTLNSHPDIRCAGEVFKIKSWRESAYEGKLGYSTFVEQSIIKKLRHYIARESLVKEYLDFLFSTEGYEAVGFKLMQNQTKKFPMLVQYLKSNDIKVIHVVRENVLKTWVSGRAAIARGYHSTKTVKKTKIQIPTKDLVKNLNRLTNNSNRWAEIFSDSPNYIRISYEAFAENKEQKSDQICDFLGLEYKGMGSSLVKLTSDDLSEVIENYEEVVNCLSGTPFEKFLSV